MSGLLFCCPWPCRLGRLRVGGLGFDEGGDPVVQFVDPVEPAVAAGDDGHLRARYEAPTSASLRRGEHGVVPARPVAILAR
jgi:hypothetical protein